MYKPLTEEQANMRLRWSDPAYVLANDAGLRQRVLGRMNEHQQDLPKRLPRASRKVRKAAQAKGEK